MSHVNLYNEGMVYGGPEEGGWWFHAGTPISLEDAKERGLMPSYVFIDDETAYDFLQMVIKPKLEGQANMSDVNTDSIVTAYVEDHKPHVFPAVRPHYE